MKRFVGIAAVALIAVSMASAADLFETRGNLNAVYDMQTAQFVQPDQVRLGALIWDATSTGWFTGQDLGELLLDWGDVAESCIGGFIISYGTDVDFAETRDGQFIFYEESNGFDSPPPVGTFGFDVADLPMNYFGPGYFTGWTVTLDLDDPNALASLAFPLAGSDLDGDLLSDFGYSYYWPNMQATDTLGPGIYWDPNFAFAPGIEDVFDQYLESNVTPGDFIYTASLWFGGWPANLYAQLEMGLYDNAEPSAQCADPGPDCLNPGGSGQFCSADISGDDCIVNLADLGSLLGSYLLSTGDPGFNPDADFDGSGTVDLSDLGTLLGQYLDDCN